MAFTPVPTPASLVEAVALLGEFHRQWTSEKRHLELRIQSLEKQLFGSRSEKLPLEDNQLALISTVFENPAPAASADVVVPEEPVTKPEPRKPEIGRAHV